MTPTVAESIIFEALMERVQTLSVGLLVAMPNQPFSVPASGRFIRLSFMPNVTGRVVIDTDGPHRHQGILQLMLVAPVDSGLISLLETAGQVADHFAADTKMVYSGETVRSVKRPTVGPSFTDKDTDLLVPVSVEYESYI